MVRSFWTWLTRKASNTSSTHGRRNKTRKERKQFVAELLESRIVPTTFEPSYVFHPHAASPLAVNGPTGTTIAQIRQAYGIAGLGDGAGTTIAIVDAYNDPNVAADLDVFDKQFGLTTAGQTLYQQYGAASTFLKVMNQSGGTSLPRGNTGWAEEIALDVEWAHAIAPGAKIILVEASSNSDANLFAAVATAAKQPNVVAVSLSWGGGEFSGQTSYDSYFLTPGVTFLASSGDSGSPAIYPATSPNVVSVGGTTLTLTSAGNITSESAWSGSGGGISTVEPLPSYQQPFVPAGTTRRANPDVAYDSDPNTGFPVYNSYSFTASQAWEQFGGTSAAAPQWAALVAIADQGRIQAGIGSLTGYNQTLPMLYQLPASDFHDITTGSSTGTPHQSAGPGYDLATGRGSPIASLVVAGLGGSLTPVANHFSVSTSSSASAGSVLTVTVTALSSSNTTVTGYTGTVRITSSDGQAVLPANATLVNGVGTFNVTLKTAGNQSVTATDTANAGITGSKSVTISAAAANKLQFGQQPSNALTGAVIAPAVTVRVLDLYGNLVSSDNTDQIGLGILVNPGGATLSGGAAVPVSGGIATFNSLSLDTVGTGYTLSATSGSLTAATSSGFNILAPSIASFSLSAANNQTAGSAFTVTVTARDSNGHTLPSYTGTVKISSSDPAVVLPADVAFLSGDSGVETFNITLKTAGTQSITAKDSVNSALTGSVSVSVGAAGPSSLAFGQQPSNAVAGAAIVPSITVRVLDLYGNLVTGDSTDQVTLNIGANPGTGTLSGTNVVTVSGGVATFPGMSINNVGTGYTLLASSGSLTGIASSPFNISAPSSNTTITGFESTETWSIVGGTSITAVRATYAAHDGTYGLDQMNNAEWIYRNDAAAQVKAGDTVSVWLKFASSADGRAYFGFGSTSTGTLSLVAAPNTGQLVIQRNLSYGFTDLATVSATYQANHWYRLEVDWGTSGAIVGKLFDSDGATLLRSVTTSTTAITSGGIAFRSIGSDKYWDTVTVTYGANNFTGHASIVSTTSGGSTSSTNPGRSTLAAVGPSTSSALNQLFASLGCNSSTHQVAQGTATPSKESSFWASVWGDTFWSW